MTELHFPGCTHWPKIMFCSANVSLALELKRYLGSIPSSLCLSSSVWVSLNNSKMELTSALSISRQMDSPWRMSLLVSQKGLESSYQRTEILIASWNGASICVCRRMWNTPTCMGCSASFTVSLQLGNTALAGRSHGLKLRKQIKTHILKDTAPMGKWFLPHLPKERQEHRCYRISLLGLCFVFCLLWKEKKKLLCLLVSIEN